MRWQIIPVVALAAVAAACDSGADSGGRCEAAGLGFTTEMPCDEAIEEGRRLAVASGAAAQTTTDDFRDIVFAASCLAIQDTEDYRMTGRPVDVELARRLSERVCPGDPSNVRLRD